MLFLHFYRQTMLIYSPDSVWVWSCPVQYVYTTICCWQLVSTYFSNVLIKRFQETDFLSYLFSTAEALAAQVTEENYAKGLIYPPFTNIRKISAHIAANVAAKAYELGKSSIGKWCLIFIYHVTWNTIFVSLIWRKCPRRSGFPSPSPRESCEVCGELHVHTRVPQISLINLRKLDLLSSLLHFGSLFASVFLSH